jgi:hypothetical protein
MFMPGDRVQHVGARSELRGRYGFVVSRVLNDTTEYVVEFGDDSYVVSVNQLVRAKYTQKDEEKQREVEIQRRRRYDPDLIDS